MINMNNTYKDLTPRNDKGESHGLWEIYWGDVKLWYTSFYHNGKSVGYEEEYSADCKLQKKTYNI